MDLGLTPEHHLLQESFASCLGKEGLERARKAEPLGFDPVLWRELVDMGVLSMSVPLEAGGDGASLLDLALVAEVAGKNLAPAPVPDAVVATRLLAVAGDELLAPVLEGRLLPTIAVRPAVDGTAVMVPSGAVADIVIGLDGDELVRCGPAPTAPRPIPTMGSMPVADRSLRAAGGGPVVVLTGGSSAFRRGLSEWRTLLAATLVGVAAGALEIAGRYVTERRQFGVPLGSFQVIAHRLADVATEVDGARLLCWEAAWALEADRAASDELAAMALSFATTAARRSAAEALHFHGGYGFMLEYDIQMHLRRAKAWPLVAGDPRQLLQEIASARLEHQEVAPWTSR